MAYLSQSLRIASSARLCSLCASTKASGDPVLRSTLDNMKRLRASSAGIDEWVSEIERDSSNKCLPGR